MDWPPTAELPRTEHAADDVVALAECRADRLWLGLTLAARLLGYTLLLLLAAGGPPWRDLLAGVLIADLATWVFGSLGRLRHESLWVAAELVVYLAVMTVSARLQPLPSLPGDVEGNGVAMIGFLGTFALKGGLLAWRFVQGDDD